MRVGDNPEKTKNATNTLYRHRVVVVFYVPGSSDEFFAELAGVLDKCLESLIATINPETTAITLIDNCSGKQAKAVAEKYKTHIDKYVEYAENKGKVYAVLNEVRGIYEEFVTISDADILFFDGWEKAVFDVFANHPKAGVVSPHPCPYLTFYFNKSVFGVPSLSRNIAYGKFVGDHDIDLYLKGTNLPRLAERKNAQFDWKQKQYILKNPAPAVIGAYHVVATYRAVQFRNVYTFPRLKFLNSYEENFIDCLADESGFYRLSTLKSYIYHIGNKLDEVCFSHENKSVQKLSEEIFGGIQPAAAESKIMRFLKRSAGRVFIKFKWNR